MVNTGLLVLTNPVRVNKLLSKIKNYVFKTLYIQYFPEKSILVTGNYGVSQLYKSPKHTQMMANIYTLAMTVLTKIDVRILMSTFKSPNVSIINTKRPIELVIFDQTYSKSEADTFIQDCLANTSMGCEFVTFDEEKVPENNINHNENLDWDEEKAIEKSVVVGGTFDRLHNGHKILLSEGVMRCSEKLTVGVTDTNMLKGKLLWELIEPCSKRVSIVKDFLEDIDSSLKYNVVPINDLYGPTKRDPNMDLIIVSEETVRGAVKINQLRAEKHLKQLQVHIVKLVEDNNYCHEVEESKISSSNLRIRLLGTRLKDPVPKNIPQKPYVIGLTGGIASGKSSVANKLENLGAGIVNCDKIAHNLYEPGQPCYNLIVENFGKEILSSNGFINRKALGDLVFSNKNELEKLNQLVWPYILTKSQEQINVLHKKGYNFIVMEAAVLIQAKWQPYCHEIWTCIIPEEETIKRLIERNNITEEEAKLRIRAQPSNVEQVNEANVVVSTLWSYDVTQQQVQKAWNKLVSYLESQNSR